MIREIKLTPKQIIEIIRQIIDLDPHNANLSEDDLMKLTGYVDFIAAVTGDQDKRIADLEQRVDHLRAALKEIAEHPHCQEDQINWPYPVIDHYIDSQWRTAHAQGHRHAAAIARRALEGK